MSNEDEKKVEKEQPKPKKPDLVLSATIKARKPRIPDKTLNQVLLNSEDNDKE